MLIPFRGQKLLTAAGDVWVVRLVRHDLFNPKDLIISLVPEARVDDIISDTTDVLASNWAMWCEVNGVIAVKALPNEEDEGATRPGWTAR